MPHAAIVFTSYPGLVVNDATDGDIAWTTPTNAQASDDSRTSATLSVPNPNSQWLVASGFNYLHDGSLMIPDNAVVVGILVVVEGHSAIGAAAWETIRIGADVGDWDGDDKAAGVWDTGSDGDHDFGGTVDTWSNSMSLAFIRDSMKVGIRANNNAEASVSCRIDSVRVDLYVEQELQPRYRCRSEGTMGRQFRVHT